MPPGTRTSPYTGTPNVGIGHLRSTPSIHLIRPTQPSQPRRPARPALRSRAAVGGRPPPVSAGSHLPRPKIGYASHHPPHNRLAAPPPESRRMHLLQKLTERGL